MLKVIDAHHHIVNSLTINSHFNTYKMDDIRNIEKYTFNNRSIGIHPLYINERIDWDLISEILEKDSTFNIGEVGLDNRSKDRSLQKTVLNKFIELSNKYDRSISIHCVKSWGEMIKSLQLQLNKDIPHLLHGFYGSKETMNILLKGNSFFSFSKAQLNNDRIIQLIKSIPIGNLLIESDMSNDHYLDIGNSAYLTIIETAYKKIAKIKNIPVDELADTININFNNFLRSKHI